MSEISERIKPIRLTDTETGEVYTLEFNRESIKYAESRGFDIYNLKPLTDSENIFFYAFRMHHPRVSKATTDKMIEDWGGVAHLPDGLFERLAELYLQGMESLNDGKNARMTIEL